jgi:C-terminal processing protease CtpA/Prc
MPNRVGCAKWLVSSEKEQPKHLILDLRNNLGGNIHTAFALIDHLTEGPMQVELERRRSKVQRHFDLKSRLFWYLGKAKFDFVPRYHRNRKPSDPSINTYTIRKKDRFRPAFKGSIIILVNPLTASSGSFAAAYLQHYAHATVIGVETGGGGMSNNGLWYPKIKAPHTGAKFNFPLLWLDYDLGIRTDQGKGVVPTLVMPYDIADILNKKDPVLEKARELCKK